MRVLSAAAFAAFLALMIGACSNDPKAIPCSNGGDCEAADPRFGFCSRGKCVECVGRGSCDGNPCVDGRCEIPCKDGSECSGDRRCVDNLCVFADF